MNDSDSLTLWLGAFRYYLGRMSYAVSHFTEMLRAEWPNLPEQARTLIRAELEDAFINDDKHRDSGEFWSVLGHDCDRASWETVRALWRT